MALQDDREAPARCAISITLSDTNEVTLIDHTAFYSNLREVGYPRWFISQADGAVFLEPVGNLAGVKVPFPIIKGVMYPIEVRKFYATGASTIVNGDIIAGR
jgi:hypothetical protein